MELYQLRYFNSIVHHGSMAAASAALNITQPALSYAISQLEKELGVSLFVRRNGKLELTAMGVVFLDSAEEAVKILDDCIDKVRSEDAAEARRVYIGVAYGGLISAAIKSYIMQHPSCHVYETLPCLDNLFHSLEIGALDCLVTYEANNSNKIERIPLFQDHLVALVPPDSPLAAKDILRIEDLQSERVIYKGMPWSMMALLSEENRNLSPEAYGIDLLYEGNDDLIAKDLAESGFGILVIPKSDYEFRHNNSSNNQQGNLVTIPFDHSRYSRTIWLYYLKKAYSNAKTRDVIDYILHYYGHET